MDLIKNCLNCVHLSKSGRSCAIFKEIIGNGCWGWADQEEFERREAAVKAYIGFLPNSKNVKGKKIIQEERRKKTMADYW